jgi:hypothetical protein
MSQTVDKGDNFHVWIRNALFLVSTHRQLAVGGHRNGVVCKDKFLNFSTSILLCT